MLYKLHKLIDYSSSDLFRLPHPPTWLRSLKSLGEPKNLLPIPKKTTTVKLNTFSFHIWIQWTHSHVCQYISLSSAHRTHACMSCIAIKQSNGDQAVAIICFNSDQVDQHNHWQAVVSGGMVIPARLDCQRTIVTNAETDISEYFCTFCTLCAFAVHTMHVECLYSPCHVTCKITRYICTVCAYHVSSEADPVITPEVW